MALIPSIESQQKSHFTWLKHNALNPANACPQRLDTWSGQTPKIKKECIEGLPMFIHCLSIAYP
jgi:hypothetical protein